MSTDTTVWIERWLIIVRLYCQMVSGEDVQSLQDEGRGLVYMKEDNGRGEHSICVH